MECSETKPAEAELQVVEDMKQEKCTITVSGHGEGHLGSLCAIHESFLYLGHIICKPIANGGLASFLPSTAMNEQKVFLIRIIMHCITCVSHIFTLPLVNYVKPSRSHKTVPDSPISLRVVIKSKLKFSNRLCSRSASSGACEE